MIKEQHMFNFEELYEKVDKEDNKTVIQLMPEIRKYMENVNEGIITENKIKILIKLYYRMHAMDLSYEKDLLKRNYNGLCFYLSNEVALLARNEDKNISLSKRMNELELLLQHSSLFSNLSYYKFMSFKNLYNKFKELGENYYVYLEEIKQKEIKEKK